MAIFLSPPSIIPPSSGETSFVVESDHFLAFLIHKLYLRRDAARSGGLRIMIRVYGLIGNTIITPRLRTHDATRLPMSSAEY
ncbi:uncharacterized protein H6S33_010928 [Morchella sextelata]|uniref:uncharacterized protein n=1 Tax=Morchella sextelata TaxID=1174677 RepID=UPI001D03AB4D|nr:uncharacterized protein H6S33_010928 [Morchella sextelata]KAH0611663.1 hypothetical protein H6S33_010928 [Morchella sextelata]